MTNDAEMAPQKLSTEAAMITAVVELTACISVTSVEQQSLAEASGE